MNIDFDDSKHVYTLNGDIASCSVTELLKKHGLAPDYSGVSQEVLNSKAERGKDIHKDLENILNTPKYEPKTREGEEFAEWVKDNMASGVGEQLIGMDYKGMLICGTADVIGFTHDKQLLVGDHKTTYSLNSEYVSWQVSLYDYMLRKNSGGKINGIQMRWAGASKFYCFHYKDSGLKVVELTKIADAEIERLLECEYNNEKYIRSELSVEPNLQEQVERAELVLKDIEGEYKQAKRHAERLRTKLKDLFEEQGIRSWESPNKALKVTYVDEMSKILVDSEKLKRNYPQIYAECTKLSTTSAHVKIKVRKENEE